MKMKKLMIATLGLAVVTPTLVPEAAFAKDRDREYRGRDYSYERCKRSSGTTGLLVGGAGGAVAGSALGGGTLGTVAGGVGGALLGKHIDKKNHKKRNRERGC